MEITPSRLRQLMTTFNGDYRMGYSSAGPWWPRLLMRVPSSSSQNDYGWMAALPKMREWLGERVIQNLDAYSYQLKNKTYEETVGVKREDILDDNLGLYTPLFQEFGRSVAKHPDELALSLLQNGQNDTIYDNQHFFDTSHPVSLNAPDRTTPGGASVQSNYFTSTPLTQANFQKVRATMMSYCDEGGRPLGIVPDLLWCGPALEPIARRILLADTITEAVSNAAGTDFVGGAAAYNVTKGQGDVLCIPELAGGAANVYDKTWGLACTTRFVKGLVFQDREPDTFVQLANLTDHNVFMRREFLYGAHNRRNVGYGLWWMMSKCTG